ncbi:hypothetical protein RMSM_00970 [Rhodopirellula maiorica SM1]|uniref:Uncharacterized protein n=1 Tax=Rhodopirellula maiorica SM1 TaxID=1265738 RepID=M5RRX2_9BACT|nr:hypothetical protein RMSM_00970 [Rhodopirellula maiorica SM1]
MATTHAAIGIPQNAALNGGEDNTREKKEFFYRGPGGWQNVKSTPVRVCERSADGNVGSPI